MQVIVPMFTTTLSGIQPCLYEIHSVDLLVSSLFSHSMQHS